MIWLVVALILVVSYFLGSIKNGLLQRFPKRHLTMHILAKSFWGRK